MKARTIVSVTCLMGVACGGAATRGEDETRTEEQGIQASPPSATPVAADYDGDGATDIALKGTNGTWYIDVAANGFGGRWDYAYSGYGGSTAVPAPADYDGDGKADLAVKDGTGTWAIDFAANGFGVWDLQLHGYGAATATPVPADYDGDGKADLSVKTSTGDWYVDYAADGFGSWNAHVSGYGGTSAVPVPADYDGDRRADLSVKDAGGCWYIDYAGDGFGAWNEIHCGYGNATAVPARGDYDGDGRADLSVKGADGTWLVDYASDGFGTWNASWCCRGGPTITQAGDYDHDGKLDLAVADTSSGYWYVDYAANGIATWDVTINNPARVLVDTARPYIKSTQVYGEGDVPTSRLTVGLRYTVDVTVEPGSIAEFPGSGGVEVNPSLGMPASVKLMDPDGSTYATITKETHRRFAITCSQPGNFPLGFQLRSAPIYYSGSQVYNPDYGIRIVCAPPSQPGIMGKVTQRVKNSAGVYVAGSPIQGAAVTAKGLTTVTDAGGGWYLPLTGGPMTVHVSAPNHSDTIAVNVTVPDSGMEIDTPLEEWFGALQSAGMNYTTYVDYSRGRTIFHTVHVDPRSAVVSAGKAGSTNGGCNTSCPSQYTQCPAFDTLITTAQSTGAVAMINGMEFDVCNGNSVGYSYGKSGYLPSEVWCDDRYASTTNCYDSDVYFVEGGASGASLYAPGNSPMFTITGLGTGQTFGIVQSDDNFLETSAEWRQLGNPYTPTWIASPINYAMQIRNPPLVANGAVIAGGDFVFDKYGNYDIAIARTSVGITPAGDLYLVVADGEGVMGGNGATGNQLAHFYRDVLGANYAMGLDSGLSTEMVLLGASGYRHVNTITGEDAAGLQVDPYAATVAEAAGAIGSVGYYVAVGHP